MTADEVLEYLELSYLHVLHTLGIKATELDVYALQTLKEVSEWLVLPVDTRKTGLLLSGNVGVGKTTTIEAVRVMLHALTQKAEREDNPNIPREKLHVVTARELCSINLRDQSDADVMINNRFLAVDELGAEDVVAMRYGNTITPVADMIYSRYEKRKPTIIATNLTLESIRDTYGMRVVDRIVEAYHVIALNNPSRRRI